MTTPRYANEADIEALAQMHVQAWDETYRGLLPDAAIAERDLTYRRDLYARLLAAKVCISFLPEVGFAQFGPQRDQSRADIYPDELFSLYVLQAHHGTGAAQALLRHATGKVPFSVGVLSTNLRAVRFYEKIGGVQIDTDRYTIAGAAHTDIIYGVHPPFHLAKKTPAGGSCRLPNTATTVSTRPMQHRAPLITPVLVAGCLIIMTSFAIRASYGVFQIPVAEEFGWLRADFSLAIAIQNLAWGIGQPIFGAIAEKIGDRKAIIMGALCYAAGLLLSSGATTPLGHQLYSVLVGFGIAGTGFGVILAVVGRAASDENRSMALAITTAAGSAGQVIGAPLAEYLLGFMTWQSTFVTFAGLIIAVLLVLPMMRSPEAATRAELEESMGTILIRAFKDPSYTLIFLGFFSCGYQLAFITAHFPAFVTEMCGPIMPGGVLHGMGITTTSALGAIAISLIGLANIGGTLFAGYLGKRYPKKYLLAGIYAGRTVIAAAFILIPMTPTTVILFSVAMGSLWLATVPLTSGLVAHIYGLRYMGTLYGIVFFSHQLGSFIGVWLGGALYDLYGTYTYVWWVGVAVGAFSAIVHLPIRERQMVPA